MRLSLLCEFPSGAAGFRQVDTSLFGVLGWFKKSSTRFTAPLLLSVFRVSDNEESADPRKHEGVCVVLVPSSDNAVRMFRVWIIS